MNRNHGFLLLAVVHTLSGCASSGKATLLGAGTGAVAGATIGNVVNPGRGGKDRIRNVFIGATIGSMVGAGIGYAAHEGVEKEKRTAFERGKDAQKKEPQSLTGSPEEPTLIPARVEARWVEEQVRGSVYIPAHFEYRIVEPARWSK